MTDPGKIDSVYDFSQKGLSELILELQKWFQPGDGEPLLWEDVGTGGGGGGGGSMTWFDVGISDL